MIYPNDLTETERRICDLLKDGERHTMKDVHAHVIDDRLIGMSVLTTHVCNLRKKLRPLGLDILCEFYWRKRWYRMVRLIGRE